MRPVWAEINLDHLIFNVRQIKDLIGDKVKLMAVVKCDAYGLGIMGILDTLVQCGADMLGVATLDEALIIRKKNKVIPVLVFGYTPWEYSHFLVRHDITQTVYCKQQAAAISLAAVKLKKTARIHVEIDTGMGRLGFQPDSEGVRTIGEIVRMPGLRLEGLYTHCPYTNETEGAGLYFTERQFTEFTNIVNQLQNQGISVDIKHVCNSLGTLHYRHMHLDMVRAGIILYGSYPQFQNVLHVKPALSVKAKIGFIKEVGPGQNVSYGRKFTTTRATKIATLPFGYGDGYSRLLTNKGEVLFRGKRAPLIGTICMDQCMVDVSGFNDPRIGEEVVILGIQGAEEITMEEISVKACGFINYEYMVLIHRRVPRIYIKDGKTVSMASHMSVT
jgi:alanine racemase